MESYDCHFFRVTQKLAKCMDIRQVGVLQSVWHALEDAGIPAQRIYRTRCVRSWVGLGGDWINLCVCARSVCVGRFD